MVIMHMHLGAKWKLSVQALICLLMMPSLFLLLVSPVVQEPLILSYGDCIAQFNNQ